LDKVNSKTTKADYKPVTVRKRRALANNPMHLTRFEPKIAILSF